MSMQNHYLQNIFVDLHARDLSEASKFGETDFNGVRSDIN